MVQISLSNTTLHGYLTLHRGPMLLLLVAFTTNQKSNKNHIFIEHTYIEWWQTDFLPELNLAHTPEAPYLSFVACSFSVIESGILLRFREVVAWWWGARQTVADTGKLVHLCRLSWPGRVNSSPLTHRQFYWIKVCHSVRVWWWNCFVDNLQI